ncbi:MAG TPA: superinfection immunity protein [Gaiellaceae bacterium]
MVLAASAETVVLGFLPILALYLFPTIVGAARGVPNIGSIFVINFFLGWTFLGWVIALAMAARTVAARQG